MDRLKGCIKIMSLLFWFVTFGAAMWIGVNAAYWLVENVMGVKIEN
jgi:hypothetical protein